MKKKLLFFVILLAISINSRADFGVWASAIYLQVNGSDGFYNTQKLLPPTAIGHSDFSGNLGVFGYNSGALKILGAEINTNKSNGSKVCSGVLYFTVFEQGKRPLAPDFSTINLGLYCNCDGSFFSGCGGGSCGARSDQKLQNVSGSVDLTGYSIGNYTLEIYYQVNGENGNNNCKQQGFDNGGGANYQADFSITNLLALNFSSLNGIAIENATEIKWVILNDVKIIKYEVQKSENGLNFVTINSVNAHRSPAANSYYFIDADPFFGTNYYRIKVYNDNGKVTLSKVFRIYFGKVGNTIFIYSNPSGTELTVRLTAVTKGYYKMSVLNNLGQQIVTMPINHDGNDKTLQINMPAILAHGIYRVFLIDKYQFYKQSFLVK